MRVQPSREVDPASSARKLLGIVLIAIAVVAALNALSSILLDRYSSNRGYQLIQAKWMKLLELEQPVDIVVLGDSSANQGVDTDLIERETGKRAINLATIGNSILLGDYWMLDNYVARFGAPQCVVVVHVFDVWPRDNSPPAIAQIPLSAMRLFPYLRESGGGLRLYAGYLVSRYVRSYAESKSLRELLMYPWRIERSDLGLTPTGFDPQSGADPERVVLDAAQKTRFTDSQAFSVSRENRKALDRMIDLSIEHGFHLAIVHSPVFEGVYEHASAWSYTKDINEFVLEQLARAENAQVVFESPMMFPANLMQNSDHVVVEAAEQYTSKLLDEIQCD